MTDVPNCVHCVYSHDVPDDLPSAGNIGCNHPATVAYGPRTAMLLMSEYGHYEAGDFRCTFDLNGIKSGLANWPMDFYPGFLETCTGFTKAPPAPDVQKASSIPRTKSH